MVFCHHCRKQVRSESPDGILMCCGICGRVLESDCYTSEPTFIKTATGQSQLGGNFVRSVQNAFSASRERIFNRARMDMDYMMTALDLSGGDFIINQAMRFYTIAYERNFTKGRRVEQVEASCLYIACRENNKPYLLIDFSEYLKVNVYVLGAVFLQLCKLLSLQEHPIVQKPVDPSLFIHRFSRGLQGADMAVTKTALRIIASMKRDWMQTGRKPSGLCGAALYISALSYGLQCSKFDIMKIVHVCEATLTKRLIEFENTESGSLTIEEFNMKADELESLSSQQTLTGSKLSSICELLCVHKDSGKPPSPFAHGLCESCYDDFVKLSGGLDGGSEPPAFQHAEEERMAKEAVEKTAKESNFNIMPCRNRDRELPDKSLESEFDIPNVSGNGTLQYEEPEKIRVGDPEGDDFPHDESLSDIDDIEVEGYLHNEEEKHYKKIIWEEMNREYLEEQAAKEAAAAAAKEAFEANFRGRPEELKAAQELAAAAAAAVAKSKKERQQKRAADAKNLGPAQTAAEATRQMLNKKRPSSKINYGVLDNLFEENEDPENPKKARAESPLNDEDSTKHASEKVAKPKESGGNEFDQGVADEYEDDGHAAEEYGDDYYGENAADAPDHIDDEY